MNEYTIKNAAHLAGHVEGYLTSKFYSMLVLFPQIPEEQIAQILNWPLSVMHEFLCDTSPQIRLVWLGDAKISITENKQRYIDEFHALCRRYRLFSGSVSSLEFSFIEASTLTLLYGVPETDFTITTDSVKPKDLHAGKEEIWGQRSKLYQKYAIDPGNCSELEHDFVQACLLETAFNTELCFQYNGPATTADTSTEKT